MIHDLLPFIVTGLATGSVFALAGMGLVLSYKTSGIFNFSHGAVAALGAYVMWDLWIRSGWPWPLALLIAVALAGVGGGLVLERVAVGLTDKTTALRVVATIGVLLAIQGALVLRYGTASIPMRFFLPDHTFTLLGVHVRYEQLIVFVLTLGSAIALTTFFKRTRLGIAMQGVVDDPALLALQGTSPAAVRRSAWIVGCCFASASGALLAPTLNLDAVLLTLLVVQAFGAAAVGRFSSLPWTYAGGLLIGVGQELLKYVVTTDAVTKHLSPQLIQPLPSNLPFVVLFVVLVATPKAALTERGGNVVRPARPPRRLRRTETVAIAALVVVAAIAVPGVVQPSRMPLYTTAACFGALFASLHLLVRTSGQVSLCTMAFAGVGAATFAHAQHAGWPFPAALAAAGLATLPLGMFVSIPAVRLSGVYLAIATFGFGLLVERMLFPSAWLFGSTQALEAHRPSFASGDTAYYYVALGVAAAAIVVVALIERARLGRLLRGMAESPAAVDAHGASANLIKLLAFCIAAALAGVAGAVLSPVTGSATGGTFNFGVSLMLLAVLAITGRRVVTSALVAAVLYVVVPGYITDAHLLLYLPVAFGLTAVLVATDVPRTALARLQHSRRLLERAPATSPRAARATLAGIAE